MAVFFVSTILTLTLIVTPICLTIKGGLRRGSGYVTLALWFIPIVGFDVRFEMTDLTHSMLVFLHRKKRREIHLNNDENDKQSVRHFIKRMPLLKAIRLRNLTVDAELGKSDDAFFTSMAVGLLRILLYGLGAFFHAREDVTVEGHLTPVYDRTAVEIDAFAIVSLTIANLIECAAIALVRTLRKLAKANRTVKRRRKTTVASAKGETK